MSYNDWDNDWRPLVRYDPITIAPAPKENMEGNACINVSDTDDSVEVETSVTLEGAVPTEGGAIQLPYPIRVENDGRIKIGCKTHTLSQWDRVGRWIAGNEKVTLEQTEAYVHILSKLKPLMPKILASHKAAKAAIKKAHDDHLNEMHDLVMKVAEAAEKGFKYKPID